MSPTPRKKKAPTAAEVEVQASEEAAKSVPHAEEDETEETPEPATKPAAKNTQKASPSGTGKPAAKKKAAPKQEDEPKDTQPTSSAGTGAQKPKAPARKRDQPRAKREPGEAAVVVRAQARYVRTSARKARLVCDHIRGKDVEQARAILSFTPRGAAKPWLKLLESAIANAEHNHELVGDELKIHSIHADEGPTLKRYRPRAMGRATRIRKRTSHLTITLTPKE